MKRIVQTRAMAGPCTPLNAYDELRKAYSAADLATLVRGHQIKSWIHQARKPRNPRAPKPSGPAASERIPTQPLHAGPLHPGPLHAGPLHPGPLHAGPPHPGPLHAGPPHPGPLRIRLGAPNLPPPRLEGAHTLRQNRTHGRARRPTPAAAADPAGPPHPARPLHPAGPPHPAGHAQARVLMREFVSELCARLRRVNRMPPSVDELCIALNVAGFAAADVGRVSAHELATWTHVKPNPGPSKPRVSIFRVFELWSFVYQHGGVCRDCYPTPRWATAWLREMATRSGFDQTRVDRLSDYVIFQMATHPVPLGSAPTPDRSSRGRAPAPQAHAP